MLKFYPTIFWDCDGVILNSNNIKTDAFRSVSLPFGAKASSELVDFHTKNGGISRYAKFDYFVEVLIPTYAPEIFVEDKSEFICDLLAAYASEVKAGLLECEIADGLRELRYSTLDTTWFIVSGGDQAELREVFDSRGISDYFDGGVYGSPKDKFTIVADLLKADRAQRPCLLVGDSRLDHQVAKAFEIDFIFLHQWTEYSDWLQYCQSNGIPFASAIRDIFKLDFNL